MDLAFPFGAQCNADVGSEPAAQGVFDAAGLSGAAPMPRFMRGRRSGARPPRTRSSTSRNGETLRHRFAREIRDDARILECEERARMTHRQLSLVQHLQHHFGAA